MKKKNIFFILFIIFALELIKADEILEDKYYFQLCPSIEKGKNFLFHAYTPDLRFLTINTTEGSSCSIMETQNVNEFPIKGLSSVISINNLALVKTCFGPNKIVEIIIHSNGTPEKKILTNANQNLNNIKFCYSSFIIHPIYSYTSIITYWTEFEIKNGEEKYTHKSIIFDLNKKTFSNVKVLGMSFIGSLFNNNFYAKNCITFRFSDIYCSINFDSSDTNSLINSFIIDTKTLFSSSSNIHLVTSNTDYGRNIYQKPILVGKEVHGIDGGTYDTFLTEYHNKEENTTLFASSLFRKSLYTSLIAVSSTIGVFYGINIEYMYIPKNLFNHIMPDQNDLIIIYAMKYGNGMGLYMSRFNLTKSIKLHASFRDYSLSNYVIPNICSNPQYIQSIYTTSFINYDAQDKEIIKRNTNKNYYKYQRDIVSLIACNNGNNQVIYEPQKIKMLQCLNVLDNLNNDSKHIIKLRKGGEPVILDIYNDPNLKSLRDASIEFLPTELIGNIISIVVTDKNGHEINVNLRETTIINNPAFIQFRNIIPINIKTKISINYRLKQSEIVGTALTCHLSSDICNFEFIIEDSQGICDIQYCLYCDAQSKCVKCDDNIYGLYLNTDSNSCVCDQEKGFKLSPKITSSNRMCICKNDYSFYKNTSLCLPNSILQNDLFYQDRKDDFSLIPIYDDCPNNCLKCKKIDNNQFCCMEIKDNNVNLPICTDSDKTDIPIGPKTDSIIISNDICLDNDLIWFKMGDIKFNFAKINNCIFVFYDNSLFFYSNKTDCQNLNDFEYIAYCLNNNKLSNSRNYYSLLDNNYEYNPNDPNVNIYKIIGDYKFHLVSTQTNKNFSDLILSKKCTKKLISKYNIDPNYKNLLIFKIDIKRNITRQVEYQLFNPEPQIMYQQLNISECLNTQKDNENQNNTRRVLDGSAEQNENDDLEMNEVNVSLPIDWNKQQLAAIDELYNNNGIFFFNETNDFYNDVCNTYETKNNSDIYLQDRREIFYITDSLCESNCVLMDYNNITNKIICKCIIKTSTDNYESSDFLSRNFENAFEDTYLIPNIRVLKCFKKAFRVVPKNFLFYLTFFLFCDFIIAYYLGKERYNPLSKDPFKELNDKIEKEMKKFKDSDDEESNDNDNDNDNDNKNNIDNKEENKEEQLIKFELSERNPLMEKEGVKKNRNKQPHMKGNISNESNGNLISNTNNFDSSKDNNKEKEFDKKTNIPEGNNNDKYSEISYISDINNQKNNKEKKKVSEKGTNKENSSIDTKDKMFSKEYKEDDDKEYDENQINNEANLKEKKISDIKSNSDKKSTKSNGPCQPDNNSDNNRNNDDLPSDFSLDIMNFDETKKYNRNLLQRIISMIKNNNTLCFVFYIGGFNTVFARVALLILPFSTYLLVNILLMTDNSSLHLYIRKEIYDDLKPSKVAKNLLTPLLIYVFTSYLKKKTSLHYFYYRQGKIIANIIEKYSGEENEKKLYIKILMLHNVETELSKFKDEMESKAGKVCFFGSVLLFCNWYLVVCYNGIYIHSLDCVLSNTFNSIFFTLLFTLVIFLASAILRTVGLNFDREIIYKISQLLNPCYIMYKCCKKEDDKNNKKKDDKNDKKKNLMKNPKEN